MVFLLYYCTDHEGLTKVKALANLTLNVVFPTIKSKEKRYY